MQGGACTNLFLMLLELLLEYASLRQFKKVTPILRLSEPAATMSAKMTHTDECPNRQDLSALNTSFSTGLPTSRCSSLPCPHHIVQHCPAHITLFSTALPTSHPSALPCPHHIHQHCPNHITLFSTALPTSHCSALPCPHHKISRSPPVPLCKQLGVKQAKGTKEQNSEETRFTERRCSSLGL